MKPTGNPKRSRSTDGAHKRRLERVVSLRDVWASRIDEREQEWAACTKPSESGMRKAVTMEISAIRQCSAELNQALNANDLTAQDKLQDEWQAAQIKTMREVGDSMREARESESVSLRELARRLKISAAFLSDMERARRSYTEKWALRAIQALEQRNRELALWRLRAGGDRKATPLRWEWH